MKWDRLCICSKQGAVLLKQVVGKSDAITLGHWSYLKTVGSNQFLLMSLDGLIYPHLIEQSRLKAGTIWTTKGNVNNLADLRKALSTGLSIGAN